MRLVALLSFIVFLPVAAFALQINEIMYDPAASDSYAEWVEIWNNGPDAVDLTDWTLCGNGFSAGYINKNDLLTYNDTGLLLPANGFAIVTDGVSGSTVLDSFTVSYTALLLHVNASSMCGGLNNGGDTLVLKGADDATIDTVTYTDDADENYSLECDTGNWFPSLTLGGTPGTVNSIIGQQPVQNQQNQSQQQNQTQQNNQSSPQTNQQNTTTYSAPANYSPLIDFSIIGRSNKVPPGSSIEIMLSAASNYIVSRDVSFCSYAKSGSASASDEACRPVTLAPDTQSEVRIYNTLKPDASGNLTLFVELRDNGVRKAKSIGLEVISSPVKTEASIEKIQSTGTGPTPAFVVKKTNVLSGIAAQILGFLTSLGITLR